MHGVPNAAHHTAAVRISGVVKKGVSNDFINGMYEATNDEYNGRPLFRKKGDGDKWLRYTKNNQWMVGTTAGKDANNDTGLCHSVQKDLQHPTEESDWKVHTGGTWEVQRSIAVRNAGTAADAKAEAEIIVSEGDVTASSSRSNIAERIFHESSYWQSNGSCPHWIELTIPTSSDMSWARLEMDCVNYDSYSPRTVSVQAKSKTSEVLFESPVKTLTQDMDLKSAVLIEAKDLLASTNKETLSKVHLNPLSPLCRHLPSPHTCQPWHHEVAFLNPKIPPSTLLDHLVS